MRTLKKYAHRLADADEVAKAKQFPFRYLAAYRELINPVANACLRKSLVKKLTALMQGKQRLHRRVAGCFGKSGTGKRCQH